MTDFTFGDKMGSKVMTLKPFSYQEYYTVVVYVCILLLYFSFLKGLNRTYGIQSISGIYKISISVHLLVFSFVRLFVHLFTFGSKFCSKRFYCLYLCNYITDLFHI